ncbi:BTAD domain-containing putative transcriptional regulator [Actinoplanes missouriensis]|uniref:AfsR/SARP family transcriptional regulator n=1 Tax=Actinoplanes missouriensis TaxID=1866 RepID=UPI0033CF5AD6
MTTGLNLELLDGFCLRAGQDVVEVSDIGQRLIALLALRRRPVRRAVIAGTLWPDKTESRASANLRSILWRMNGTDTPGVVVCCGSSLGLQPGLGVDVVTLEEAGWALLDGSLAAATSLGFERLSQELLPGWYEDWVIVERERLGQLQIRFLEALVDTLRRSGKFARAIDYAMRLVATDPLRERSQLALIHALVDEGSWGRARWQADQYRDLLRETFGPRAAESFAAEHAALLPFDSRVPGHGFAPHAMAHHEATQRHLPQCEMPQREMAQREMAQREMAHR